MCIYQIVYMVGTRDKDTRKRKKEETFYNFLVCT